MQRFGMVPPGYGGALRSLRDHHRISARPVAEAARHDAASCVDHFAGRGTRRERRRQRSVARRRTIAGSSASTCSPRRHAARVGDRRTVSDRLGYHPLARMAVIRCRRSHTTRQATPVYRRRSPSNVYNAPPPPPPPAPPEIVIHAARASSLAGAWRSDADATAASGARLAPERQRAEADRAACLASQLLRDRRFQAEAGVPVPALDTRVGRSQLLGQRLGVRPVQRQRDGQRRRRRIGSAPRPRPRMPRGLQRLRTSRAGAGRTTATASAFSDRWSISRQSGPQTIRIQGREDGLSIDQIVLSPALYLTTAPGAVRNDTTILSEAIAPPPPPPPPPPRHRLRRRRHLRHHLRPPRRRPHRRARSRGVRCLIASRGPAAW